MVLLYSHTVYRNKVDNELLDHLHLQFKMMVSNTTYLGTLSMIINVLSLYLIMEQDNDNSGSLDKTELLQRMKQTFQFLNNTVSNQSQEQRPTHSRKSTISRNESRSDTLLEPLVLSHEGDHNEFII